MKQTDIDRIQVLFVNPRAKINHLDPQGETIQLPPVIEMARVPSKVDSESRDTFISQSTWRTSGLPEVTQPVKPNLLTPFWHVLYFYRGGSTEKQVDLSSL